MRRSQGGAALVCCAVVAGCGSGSGSGHPQDPLLTYYNNKARPAVMCSTLSQRFLRFYGGGSECPRRIVPSRVLPQPTVQVREVAAHGGRAAVTFKITPGGVGQAVVVRESGRWKLDSMQAAPEQRAREH